MGKSSKLPCHSLGKSANLTHDKTFLTVSNRFVSSLDSPFVIFQNTEQFLWHLFHFLWSFMLLLPPLSPNNKDRKYVQPVFLGWYLGKAQISCTTCVILLLPMYSFCPFSYILPVMHILCMLQNHVCSVSVECSFAFY